MTAKRWLITSRVQVTCAAVYSWKLSDSTMAAFGDDDDFERAQSAFPELDDDFGGFGNAPVAPAPISSIASEPLDFSFDPVPASNAPPVKVTGDDEIEKFESQFPDLGGVSSSLNRSTTRWWTFMN